MPGQAVDRDDRLGADLIILPGPDQAGLDRAGGLAALAAVHRRRHGHLDHRDQTVEGRGQSHVLHVMLQIFKAVFDGDAVIEIVGVQHRTVRAVARRLEREVVAEIAGDRKRPQPRQRRGQIAHALAPIEHRRQRGVIGRAEGLDAPGMRPVLLETNERHGLVRRIDEQLVLHAGGDAAGAVQRR